MHLTPILATFLNIPGRPKDMSYVNVQFHWISKSSGVLIASFSCAIIHHINDVCQNVGIPRGALNRI